MSLDITKRPPDPFGDDEGIFNIDCHPATIDDLEQVAFLTVGLLEKHFGANIGRGGSRAIDFVTSALKKRLRLDSTWVMSEGETVIGMIDLETPETRKLNGFPLPRLLADEFGYTEKVMETGLGPLLVHEPAPDEAHQSLVALMPGSRGEGRGTLLLMHGAFWAQAQGKHWITAWLPEDDPGRQIYERRGYIVDDELETRDSETHQKWVLLKRPLSSHAHKILRQSGKNRK